MKKATTVLAVLLLATAMVFAQAAGEQTKAYPEKGIEINVGYAAGGASDIAARMIAPFMEKELGQSVTVINMPGAGGEIAHTALSQAEPDGYYLGLVHAPATISIPISRKAAYTLDDFVFIGNIVFHENLIVVEPNSRFKPFQDIIDEAKANPGKITIGNSGPYADDHLASLTLQNRVGIKLEDTMFKGTAPSLVALLGGHIDLVMCNVADIVEKEKQGQVRVVATLGAERNPHFPDAPTLKELGYDVEMGNYTSLAAPAKTPDYIIDILRKTFDKVSHSEEFQKKVAETGLPAQYFNAEDTAKAYNQTAEKLKKLWVELDLPTAK